MRHGPQGAQLRAARGELGKGRSVGDVENEWFEHGPLIAQEADFAPLR